MDDHKLFGRELRRLRRQKNPSVSLADLADAIGCSITYISAIERGERNPPSSVKIKQLLSFLGEEPQFGYMSELALRARQAVEIPIDTTNNKLTDVLFSLARRSEEGSLAGNESLLDRLASLLKEDEEK